MRPLPYKYIYLIILSLLLLLMALVFFWIVRQERVLSRGIDNFQSHRLLYGERQVTETIKLPHPVTKLGAIIVGLKAHQPLSPVHIQALNATGQTIASAEISSDKIQDDQFAWVEFNPPLPAQPEPVTLVFSAPTATNQTPLGIRFDSELPHQPLALSLEERVPVGLAFSNRLTNSRDYPLLIFTFLASALLTSFTFLPRRFVQLSALLLIVALAVTGRFLILPHLHGVSGGDPYNYLTITKNISELENPFATKRLPGWPLLLLPAWLTDLPDTTYMRTLSILSAGGVILALAALAKTLQLPWVVQLTAPALLAFQKDFLATSLRPEPYTFYTLLLLTSLTLFFHLKTKPRQIIFGLVLGYAAMTRQEGFLLAAVLSLCATLHLVNLLLRRQPWHTVFFQYFYAFLPALLFVTPFFIHNTLEFGNPLFTPYFEGERLNIVDSWPAFQDAVGGTWGVLGSLWKPSWNQLERLSLTDPHLQIGLLATLGWSLFFWLAPPRNLSRPIPQIIIFTLGFLIFALIVNTALSSAGIFSQNTFKFAAGALLISPLPFLLTTKWRGAVVFLVLVSQILIATWFHPFPKHYQQAYPLLTLLLASAWFFSSPRRWPAFTPRLTLFFTFLLASAFLFTSPRLIPYIDKSNEQTAFDSVLSRAIDFARAQPSPHGFDQYYQPALLYFKPAQTHYYADQKNSSTPREHEWVEEIPIKTLVVTNIDPVFLEPAPHWQELAHYKAAGKNEFIFESWVYRIQP
jgi:hypothetical protein